MRLEVPIEDTLTNARVAIKHARSVRDYHAKRSARGTRQRELDIKLALEKLKEAMKPVHRHVARMQYRIGAADDELREMSRQLQVERRKLWKMKQPSKRTRKLYAKRKDDKRGR